MPRYDYRCDQCGTVFEVRATIKEKEAGLEPVCPECQSPRARQVIRASLAVLSGKSGGSAAPSCGPDCGPGCCS